jgi:RimJ/RimL family protein N-acetyltransferase
VTLETPRLWLRQWREEDFEPFAALNSDPETMRYFPARLRRAESDAFAERAGLLIALRGWGLWAVELKAGGEFIGFVGLNEVDFQADFTPAVEVGWRLARQYWGNGYATEAARAAVDFGFRELGLEEIVAMTTPANQRSRRVMERLGMVRDPAADFDHPRFPAWPLRRHVLYRLARRPRRG